MKNTDSDISSLFFTQFLSSCIFYLINLEKVYSHNHTNSLPVQNQTKTYHAYHVNNQYKTNK